MTRSARHARNSVLIAAFLACLSSPAHGGSDTLPPYPEAEGDRPGWLKLGPLYLTPRLRIGSLGLDTNVFYSATERQADVSGSGGPALDVVLPLQPRVRLQLNGGVNYLYFVRTESQRRLLGDARAGFEAKGARTELKLDAAYQESFSRPSFEVDTRVAQKDRSLSARARRRLFGRTQLALEGAFTRINVSSGQEFLGTDLGRTLSRERTAAAAALEYFLTSKTRLILRDQFERHHFLLDASRDADDHLATFGIRSESQVLLSGQAVVGVRRRLSPGRRKRQDALHAAIDVTWHLGRWFRIGGRYDRDLGFTPFAVEEGDATLHREAVTGFAHWGPIRRVDLRVAGQRARSRTAASVRLELPSGETETRPRDDVTHELRGDLTYRLRERFRIGVAATYSDRTSSFQDLGVDGLLVGGTVVFTP